MNRPSLTLPARTWRRSLARLLIEDSGYPAPMRDLFYFTTRQDGSAVVGIPEAAATVRLDGAQPEGAGAEVGWAPLRETARLLRSAALVGDDDPVRVYGPSGPQSDEAGLVVGALDIPLALPYWSNVVAHLRSETRAPEDLPVTEVSTVAGADLQRLLHQVEPLLGSPLQRGHLRLRCEGRTMTATVIDRHNLLTAQAPLLERVDAEVTTYLPRAAVRLLRGLDGTRTVTVSSGEEVDLFSDGEATYALPHERTPAREPDEEEALSRWDREVTVSPTALLEVLGRCAAILVAKNILSRGVDIRIASGRLQCSPRLPKGRRAPLISVTDRLPRDVAASGLYPLDLLIEMITAVADEPEAQLRFGGSTDPLQIKAGPACYVVMPGVRPY